MAKKKLNIGGQAFRHFSEENMIYVDKTEKIHELMQLGQHNFFVRPRRFGKSLLLDTIGSIHKGNREPFVGTWAYDNLDWEAEKRPVLRIDFTLIEYNKQPLEVGLAKYLHSIAKKNGIDLSDKNYKEAFSEILEEMGKEKGVVVLIDEYEMALLDFVGVDDIKLEENIAVLKKFYGTMKGASKYIHRSYITGISKIGQIGIFSDLNMLNDLTMDERFTTLLGYTEQELSSYYAEYITEAAQRFECTEEELLGRIKHQYNGYSWDGVEGNKVYNPFSIINFFQSFHFRNYWFATGTPTILTRGARQSKITLADLENIKATGDLLGNANLKEFYSIALLFQTGYLTIKKAEKFDWDIEYTLGFPNQEVRESFASHLLAEYTGQDWEESELTLAYKLRMHLQNEELKQAFQIFSPVIASTGYDLVKHTEGYFHTIMHVLMYSTGLTTFSELQSLEGRLDTICTGYKAIYVFEFKLDGTADAALAQIKAKKYAAPFLAEQKAIYLVGVNFVSAQKKIDNILVEKWDGAEFVRLEGDFTPVEGK
jgi:hypothetical protein